MRYILFALFGGVLFHSCTLESYEEQQASKLDSLFEAYQEEQYQLYPLMATAAGDNRYNAIFHNELTQEFRERQRAFNQKFIDSLVSIDRAVLNETQQMSYDILLRDCRLNLEGLSFRDHLMPINQFWSTSLTIGQLASGESFQPFYSVEDYENWLSRLEGYLQWCETAIVNMREGMALGFVLPKALTEKVIPQLAELAQGPVDAHLFYGPINNMPESFSEGERQRLTSAYFDMIENGIIPAHQRLLEFFEMEYLPTSRQSSGISDVPDGVDYYNYLIKVYTTTNLTAEEIYQLGLDEVNRITREMEIVKDQVGFEGDLKSFFNSLRSKEELTPYTTPQQVLDHFRNIHDRIKPNISKLFNKVPKTDFEIRRTESFREASASAEYSQGSLDGTRPGIFYVPIPDASTYNVLGDESLFLHEAIPGHHYQISLQQENEMLPDFRKTLFYSAFGEGWALYSESLGGELGLYTDPYQYFGMLSSEMHRAIRLVVDAGIHTQGWTREEAIQYSLDHEAETEESIIAEIERYMAIPGQALSYKVGQLTVQNLRNRAQRALSDRFDIRLFHDQVLESGCVPLSLLEQKVQRWIDAQLLGRDFN